MFQHIPIPTDGSELSVKAITHGVDLAKGLGAKITALTVLEPWNPKGDAEMMEGQAHAHEMHVNQRAHTALGIAVDAANEAGVAISMEQVLDAHPYEAIIETAELKGCDLIVMASHGWKGVKGLVLGSETTKVLTHSTIPVIVVR
jgi:nucleotide-binding universal stress UspA family protein